jgi:hypothetical protein
MCEEKVLGLKRILRSLAARVPRIAPQRDEEMFPALKESMVSALCMCAQKRISLSMSIILAKETNTLWQTCVTFHNLSDDF